MLLIQGYDPPWSEKSQNKLLWRGSTTGADFTVDSPWRLSQRSRIHFMSRETQGQQEVIWADPDEQLHIGNFSKEELNHLYMVNGSPYGRSIR